MGRKRGLLGIAGGLAVCWAMAGAPPAVAGLWPESVDGKALPTLAPMVEKVLPGVVSIAAATRVQVPENPLFNDPFFRQFFDLPQRRAPKDRVARSLGSGVVVDAGKGYILTNHHVIDKAEQVTVRLNDGRSLTAKLVGSDPETDIALLQVSPEKLTALPVGDSDQVRVGDFVVAVGNPFGLGGTVTSGIVSALGRSGLGIEGYEDFIQTDASINPGNSGGALVNLRGELVGLNTAILAKGGGNVGIGFAIPANMVRRIMEQLAEYGEVRRGLLGVQTQDLTPDLAAALELKDEDGALIAKVVAGSAAEQAGLRSGDVIVGVNGRSVRGESHLRNIIGLLRVGERVNLTYIRDKKRQEAAATVTEPMVQRSKGGDVHPLMEGAVLEAANGGVMVQGVRRNTLAARLGLQPGDMIESVNQQPVEDLDSLKSALERDKRSIQLDIRRGEATIHFSYKLR
ncbi:MAG: Do family serine endopeptidase [Magnetococcales bacterium]|nr:Do family serine endopeptidase [Magnetococcales bacterium]